MQANFRRKRSQWNDHTHPIVELPLVECCSAAVPRFFLPFFMHLLQVLVCFCTAIILFKTLRQLLEPNSGTKNTLYWALFYHAGIAPGRVGQCCNALAFCIIYACSCSYLPFLYYIYIFAHYGNKNSIYTM